MPHVIVKSYPKNLTAEQKQAFTDELNLLIQKHLNCKPEVVSIDHQEIQPELWEEVANSDITPRLEQLLKKPGTRN